MVGGSVMIVLCSLSDLDKYKRSSRDINFMIVRNYKEPIEGITQFERLAPSEALYTFAMRNKEKPDFYEVYHKAFQKELISNEKQVGLSIIEDLVSRGFEVNLICYCKKASECHRSDVFEALKSRGIECELY